MPFLFYTYTFLSTKEKQKTYPVSHRMYPTVMYLTYLFLFSATGPPLADPSQAIASCARGEGKFASLLLWLQLQKKRRENQKWDKYNNNSYYYLIFYFIYLSFFVGWIESERMIFLEFLSDSWGTLEVLMCVFLGILNLSNVLW